MDLIDYTNTTRWKSGHGYGYSSNNTAASSWTSSNHFTYQGTSAISSLVITSSLSGNFYNGSLALYGIKDS